MTKITKEIKASIVGYWRCGAPLEQICWIVKLRYNDVFWIIEDYKKTLINE